MTVDNHRVGIGRLHPLNEGLEHRPAYANHVMGRVENALNGVLDIGGRKGFPVVPLHALVQVKGNGFAPVAELPGMGQFGHHVERLGVVGTGAHQTVVDRRRGSIDAGKGRLVHVKVRQHFVPRTEEFATVARLFAVGGGKGQWPLPDQVSIRGGRLLCNDSCSHPDHQQ